MEFDLKSHFFCGQFHTYLVSLFLKSQNASLSLSVFKPHRIPNTPPCLLAGKSPWRAPTARSSRSMKRSPWSHKRSSTWSKTTAPIVESPFLMLPARSCPRLSSTARSMWSPLSLRIVLAPSTMTSRLGTANSSKSTRPPYSISFWFVHSTFFEFFHFFFFVGLSFLLLSIFAVSLIAYVFDCLVKFGGLGFRCFLRLGLGFLVLTLCLHKPFSVLVWCLNEISQIIKWDTADLLKRECFLQFCCRIGVDRGARLLI